MKVHAELRVFVLRSLARCNGLPLPEETLEIAAQMAFPHHAQKLPTTLPEVILGLEEAQCLARVVNPITEVTVLGLTDQGRLAAASLPR